MQARFVFWLASALLPMSAACGPTPAGTGGTGGSSGAPGSGGTAGSSGTWTARALPSPPSYRGSVNGGAACTQSYATAGFEPIDPANGRHPLFLYFVGTTFGANDQGSRFDAAAPKAIAEAMARRGFVALSVQYDNGLTLPVPNKTGCLFGPQNAASILAVACALPQVDCDRGIATWGHSQGALMAHVASNYDARVRAVWATGYSGSTVALSPNRLRVVNGENDIMNNGLSTLNRAAGFTAGECPDDGRKECLRSDGSGWILVQRSQCRLTTADHCWFNKKSCGDSAETLEPNWIERGSTTPFALESNADWLARTVAR